MDTLTNAISDNKQQLSQIEELQAMSFDSNTVRNVLFGSAIFAGGSLFLMFAGQIITGVFAFILTAAAGIGIPLTWKYMKSREAVYMKRWRDKALEDLINETRDRALISLRQQVLDNTSQLEKQNLAIIDLSAIKKDIQDYARDFDKTHPYYQKIIEMVKSVEVAFDNAVVGFEQAKAANAEFDQEVQIYAKYDKITRAVGKFMDAYDQNNGQDLKKMLSIEAFDAISQNFNKSMAAVERGTAQVRDIQGAM